jgi:arylsulfatase A-like enzyme
MNVLLITLDQFRGECLGAAGHPIVQTPNLDRLCAAGVRLANHFSQAAPCGPGRAALYTGTYQMNNRVVANGTPLDQRFDNIALAARRAGYSPALFGYTDQSIDPRVTSGPDDPRLSSYEGILPGFDWKLDLSRDHDRWLEWLRDQGHHVGSDVIATLASEPQRPAEHSVSAFLTDHLIEWIEQQDGPWFAHASYLRPHPPYAAAGRWSAVYDPADVLSPVPPNEDRHPAHELFLRLPISAAPTDEAAMRHLIAQYYGMISEVDDQLGRVWATLERLGQWDDTVIVITADHGEQLGDQGLLGKLGWFESSYRIIGIVRHPHATATRGTVVNEFTENVDVFPTLCAVMHTAVPAQCDGLSLIPFLEGQAPPWWRTAASWEFDWRFAFIGRGEPQWPWDRRLERQNLTVRRATDAAYVQFAYGSWLAFDLAADPTWGTALTDESRIIELMRDMLVWRQEHTDRTLTDMLVEQGGIGRWPAGVRWR